MRGKLILILLIVVLSGCEPDRSIHHGETRIVSLSPGMTETLFALGLGERLVGRSDYCDFPPQALDLSSAGTSLAPGFEAIAALHPDIVLIEANQTSHRDELGRLAEVVELSWLDLDEVTAGIRELGRRFDAEQQAEQLARRFEQRLAVTPAENAPRVLLTLGANVDGSPLWYIRRNSLHGAALHAAGARNAVDRDVSGNVSLSIEGLLALDPDIIIALLPETGVEVDQRAEVRSAFGALRTLRAVRENRIGVVVGAGYLRTGPRVLDLVDQLKAELTVLQNGVDR